MLGLQGVNYTNSAAVEGAVLQFSNVNNVVRPQQPCISVSRSPQLLPCSPLRLCPQQPVQCTSEQMRKQRLLC